MTGQERIGERIKILTDQIAHMASIAHQAYHYVPDRVGWQECPIPFCADAKRVIDETHDEATRW